MIDIAIYIYIYRFIVSLTIKSYLSYDDVIKWKYFPRYWPFMRWIHRSPVNFLHEGQWRGALMFSLINAWAKGWANTQDAGDLRGHRAHYDVTVMVMTFCNPALHYNRDYCPVKHSWNRNDCDVLINNTFSIFTVHVLLSFVVFDTRMIAPVSFKHPMRMSMNKSRESPKNYNMSTTNTTKHSTEICIWYEKYSILTTNG